MKKLPFLPSMLSVVLVFALSACSEPATQQANAQQTATTQVKVDPIPPRANDEPRPSPNASVSQTVGTTEMTISYGRPGVKGRDVFGGLEPYGEVWRAGANEATVFSFSDDVTINGQPLAAGTYAFFVIPEEEGDWTLIFNSTAEQWGAYRYDESQDALRVPATPETGASQEWLSYSFDELAPNSARVVLHWSDTMVPFTVAVP